MAFLTGLFSHETDVKVIIRPAKNRILFMIIRKRCSEISKCETSKFFKTTVTKIRLFL